jgi:hypothetical protein
LDKLHCEEEERIQDSQWNRNSKRNPKPTHRSPNQQKNAGYGKKDAQRRIERV